MAKRSVDFDLREWHIQYYSVRLTEDIAQAFINKLKKDDDYSPESLQIINSLTPEDVLDIATKVKPDIELKFKHIDWPTATVYDLLVDYCREYAWDEDFIDDECTDSDYNFIEIEDEN